VHGGSLFLIIAAILKKSINDNNIACVSAIMIFPYIAREKRRKSFYLLHLCLALRSCIVPRTKKEYNVIGTATIFLM
jgi:enterochelin esterase-like enzyme